MGGSTTQQRSNNLGGIVAALNARGPIVVTLAVGLLAFVLLFSPEIRAAIEVWNASTAYSHCYLVLPMALYLLWDRRGILHEHTPKPEPSLAILALPIAAIWLVAERLGIMEGRQLAALAGVELLFLVVLGRHLYWQLSGPLLFLVFLVPFGAFITPVLQRFTADFTVLGLNLLGIPNYADNFIIETPAGTFFVAEACAGLRFLIAAIAFGVFYALLNYQSSTRRFGFIAASLVVPIVANGFRALGIVVLGQILGSAEAAAADHIVYGWVFFSIVMLLLVGAGQAFRDTAPRGPGAVSASRVAQSVRTPVWGAVVATILVGLGPAAARAIDARSVAPSLSGALTLDLPTGCAQEATTTARMASRRVAITCGDDQFDVAVNAFPARSTSSAMVAERRRVTQEIGAEDVTVAPLATPPGDGNWSLVQTTDPNRTTATASWVDGKPAIGGLSGRLAQARDSLLGTEYFPILITVSAAEPSTRSVQQRRATLAAIKTLIGAQRGLSAKVAAYSRLDLRDSTPD